MVQGKCFGSLLGSELSFSDLNSSPFLLLLIYFFSHILKCSIHSSETNMYLHEGFGLIILIELANRVKVLIAIGFTDISLDKLL